jgi:hypothetical protein
LKGKSKGKGQKPKANARRLHFDFCRLPCLLIAFDWLRKCAGGRYSQNPLDRVGPARRRY